MCRNDLAIVTGGSKGIGLGVVKQFAESMDVLCISSTGLPSGINDQFNYRIHDLKIDLSNVGASLTSLLNWLNNEENAKYRVKYLIHNAAILSLGKLNEVERNEIDKTWNVNVHSPLAITTAIYNNNRFVSQGAKVLYITSSAGRQDNGPIFAGLGLYSITKAALNSLALIQAREFELNNSSVQILRVYPGIVATQMQHDLRNGPRCITDPKFVNSIRVPDYQDGDWPTANSPANMDKKRTISPIFSAKYLFWVAINDSRQIPNERDFYSDTDFHEARLAGGL